MFFNCTELNLARKFRNIQISYQFYNGVIGLDLISLIVNYLAKFRVLLLTLLSRWLILETRDWVSVYTHPWVAWLFNLFASGIIKSSFIFYWHSKKSMNMHRTINKVQAISKFWRIVNKFRPRSDFWRVSPSPWFINLLKCFILIHLTI